MSPVRRDVDVVFGRSEVLLCFLDFQNELQHMLSSTKKQCPKRKPVCICVVSVLDAGVVDFGSKKKARSKHKYDASLAYLETAACASS